MLVSQYSSQYTSPPYPRLNHTHHHCFEGVQFLKQSSLTGESERAMFERYVCVCEQAKVCERI